MKILFLINSMHTAGGTERMTAIIANRLAHKGYDIGVICLHGGGKPFFTIDSFVKLHYINPEGYRSIYRSYLSNVCKLRRLYKKEYPDFVVDVCSAMSLMSIPAACRGVTRVITWEHFNSNVDWNPITTPLSRRLAAWYSAKIVTLTEQDALNYQKRYKATNVMALPNPITIELTSTWIQPVKRVLAIGRFTQQKGFDLLLQAWSMVDERKSEWKLRIIGHGEMEQQLKSIVVKLNLTDSVEILPPTSDVINEYRNASIYVMSSRFEGLPLVLIEAMAMGLPVVSFDCETGPRDIVVDGKTGILVEPLNVKKLALSIDNLIQDEAARKLYSQNAIIESRRFDLETIVEKWQQLINDIF